MSAEDPAQQQPVDRFFDRAASYWGEIYQQSDVQGLVYRRRMETALQWVFELALAPGAKVLDAGCGAGLLSAELARAGFRVTSTDSSPEMVQLTRRRVTELGLAERVEVRSADVHQLPFPGAEFELVIGLGLLPWLSDPAMAVSELARVLAPGGAMILTADNRHRLNALVEPRESPLLLPLKLARRRWRVGPPRRSAGAPSRRDRPREIDAMLLAAGVAPVRRATVGYGPFTMVGRRILPDRAGTWVHRQLERASAQHPRLRARGWHYIVSARKGTPPLGAGVPYE